MVAGSSRESSRPNLATASGTDFGSAQLHHARRMKSSSSNSTKKCKRACCVSKYILILARSLPSRHVLVTHPPSSHRPPPVLLHCGVPRVRLMLRILTLLLRLRRQRWSLKRRFLEAAHVASYGNLLKLLQSVWQLIAMPCMSTMWEQALSLRFA